MSYIQKTVSSQAIIAKIYRTFKPTNSSWIVDTIENIGWAIQAIGYHAGFTKSDTGVLEVKNHRVKIPCEVERIIAIGHLIADSSENNILNADGTTPTSNSTTSNQCGKKEVRLRLGSDLTGYGLSTDNPRTTKMTPSENYYNLNPDYVITSFETGFIKIYYVGFTTDKEGLPLVLDDFDYKTCIEWYCVSQMLLAGYKNPNIDFRIADSKFEEFRFKAENACKAPSIDATERFAATWLRFSGSREFANDFFMNLEQPELKDLS